MNTDEQVLSLLIKIQDQNTNILNSLAATQVGLADMEIDVRRNTEWINGNGKEGAKIHMDRIERDLQDLKLWKEEFVKNFTDRVVQAVTWRLTKVFAVPVIIAVLTGAVALIYSK